MVYMPVRALRDSSVVRDPSPDAPRTERAAYIDIESIFNIKFPEASYPNGMILSSYEYQRIGPWFVGWLHL
jgi:hypothetical protein